MRVKDVFPGESYYIGNTSERRGKITYKNKERKERKAKKK